MKLSLRAREDFYHQLGQLLRSGVALPAALDLLLKNSRGALHQLVKELQNATATGQTMAETFAHPWISPMETSILQACARSGRFEYACEYLARYFLNLRRSRSLVLRKLAYPFFVLHFGVFTLALPKLIGGAGSGAYLQAALGFLAALYLIAGSGWILIRSLRKAGARSAIIDRLLRAIPVLGPLRRAFALGRFCATYDMQLNAGVNVMLSLEGAARASQSGSVIHCVHQALPAIRAGNQVGPLLNSAFPERMRRAWCIAEETGGLDTELQRLSASFDEEVQARLETATTWVPKLISLLILLYLAYQIIGVYRQATAELNELLGG